jgi:hypothetical protein
MESGFPFTFNFSTFYLEKIKLYIFSRQSNVPSISHKIFINFVEILKLLQIFEVLVTPIIPCVFLSISTIFDIVGKIDFSKN